MNKKVVLIVAIVAFVALLAGASVVYTLLTTPGNVGNTPGSVITGSGNQDNSGQDGSGQNGQGPGQGNSGQSGTENLEQAPDITFQDSNGNMVRLSDFKGQPIVFNYWASWCPPCVAEMPEFEKLYKEFGSELQFIMLNSTDGQGETIQTATQFIEGEGFTFPVFFDVSGDGALAYDINAIPQTFFIDRNGNIVYHRIGMISEKELRDGIALIK